jgi:hypothetical protein
LAGVRFISIQGDCFWKGRLMGNEQESSSRRGMAKGLWLVGLGLLANAGVSLYTKGSGSAGGLDFSVDQKAFAQALQSPNPQQMLGARGLYMMPAQLGPQAWGIYLMDVDSGTFCVYQVLSDPTSGSRVQRVRLAAARSFKQDRFLEDWNNEKPTPTEVGAIVQQQRQRQGLRAMNDQPTVDPTKKPEDPLEGLGNGPDLPK